MNMPKELLDTLRAQLDKHGYESTPANAQKLLDGCCRAIATEHMSLDLDIPQEVCADGIKQLVLEGHYVMDFDKQDRVRLTRAPSQTTN